MNRVHMLRRLHILSPISPISRDFGQYVQCRFLVFLRDDLRLEVEAEELNLGAGDGDRTRNQRLGKPLLYH